MQAASDLPSDFEAAYDWGGLFGILRRLASPKPEDGTKSIDVGKTLISLRKPFSHARYAILVEFFGEKDPFERWGDVAISSVFLPTLVVEKVFVRAIESFVGRGSIGETPAGLFMSGTFQTLVHLFGGILSYRLEHSGGGKIEGEILCRDNVLILTREVNRDQHFLDVLAQVVCELCALWHLNRRANSDVDETRLVPVYACLCDAADAYFVSYDSNRFHKRVFTAPTPKLFNDGKAKTADASLDVFFFIFTIFLESYYRSVVLETLKEALIGDEDRQTTSQWLTVAHLAAQSLASFRRAAEVKSNERAEQGLALLFKSLEAWPPAQQGEIELLLPTRIETWAKSVTELYSQRLGDDPDAEWTPPSFENKERRQKAVDSFWQRLNPDFRRIFEPSMIFEGESFRALSLVARDTDQHRESLEERGPVIMVSTLLKELAKSHKEGHWKVDLV
ncbi:hypothetical protein B0H19DRAFT_1114354 [Mycena capillaripes]|nr:hypothetical protein B0H19DRAFT_1114354 [Mycena capillaripes]